MNKNQTPKGWLALFVLLGGCTLASCGGGGEGNNNGTDTTPPAPTDTTPPVISSTSPAEGAVSASPDSVLTATFNEAMDASTINANTFTVAGISGSVTYDAARRTATFEPAAGFEEGTRFAATIAAGAKDMAGNPLAGAHTWNFTTWERTWTSAAAIPGSNGTAARPEIASDARGNAIAVWMQSDGTRNQVFANRYSADAGWSTAIQLLANPGASSGDLPQITMDANGNAIAIWTQHSLGENLSRILTSRYRTGSGWEAPEVVDTSYHSIHVRARVQVLISDNKGSSFATWAAYDSNELYSVRMSLRTAESGWVSVTPPSDSVGIVWPSAAFDPNGRILVFWIGGSNLGGRYNLYTSHYDRNSGWTPSSSLSAAGSVPSVAIDASGNAIAVWNRDHGMLEDILSRRYNTHTGWTQIETINGMSGYALWPQIAMDGGGNALVAWFERPATGSFRFRTNRYVPGIGWSTAETLDTGIGNVRFPRLALDGHGNAISVFANSRIPGSEGAPYDSIRSLRYSARTGWSPYKLIDTLTPAATDDALIPTAGSVRLAVETHGRALAVWDRQNRESGVEGEGIFFFTGLGVYFSRYE